jgi:inorganic pyrophosphatase
MKEIIDEIYSKYLGKSVFVKIDRPMNSKHPKHAFVYELNYGFVPDTIAPDGKEIDAYVLGADESIENFTGKCIAIIHRLNDQDDKLIVASEGMEFNDDEIKRLTNFQEQFFQSVIVR